MSHMPVIRKSVLLFANDMENKLQQFDQSKPDWNSLNVRHLYSLLLDEVGELHAEILTGESVNDVVLECVDIANFAMMIADRLVYQNKNRGRQ